MRKGFTLIELLVVIAIIGILSSVVLASLNSARSKGTDAAIKSNLANARAQAEIYYDIKGDYDGVCASTTEGIAKFASSTTLKSAACEDAATGWALQSNLSDSSTWCVDYKGQSKAGTASEAGCSSN